MSRGKASGSGRSSRHEPRGGRGSSGGSGAGRGRGGPAAGARPVAGALWPVSVHNLAGQTIMATLVIYLGFAGVLAFYQPMDVSRGPADKLSPIAKATPPDESAHVAYFEWLLAHHRFPILTSATGNYEAHQPPLYYLIATPVYSAFLGLGKARALIAVRVLNVLIGAASILVLARLAMLAFPGNGWFVAFATLFGGLWPARFVACSGAGNDPLVELASLVALLVLAKVATRPPRALTAFWAGLAIGVALLSKSSALPLVPVGLLAVYLSWKRGAGPDGEEEARAGKGHKGAAADGAAAGSDGQAAPDARQLVLCAAALLAGVLILWGPWGVRNTVIYGDPFAAAAFQRIFEPARPTPAFFLSHGLSGVQYFELVAYQTGLSFWGVFGQSDIFLPAAVYAVGFIFWGLTILAALSGLVWRASRPPEEAGPIWSLVLLLGVLMLAFFLRFNAVFYQAQARYFMPATAFIAFYLARPWSREDWPPWLRGLGPVAFLVGVLPMIVYMMYMTLTQMVITLGNGVLRGIHR